MTVRGSNARSRETGERANTGYAAGMGL